MLFRKFLLETIAQQKENKELKKEEERLEKLRQDFIKRFTPECITILAKEDYVQGLGDKSTFCHGIENTLKDLGGIQGTPARKFGLFVSKKTKKYVPTKKFGSTDDECMTNIRKEICNLIEAGNSEDYEKIRASKFAPLVRGKILATYYPNKFLNIFKKEHVERFLKMLDIPFSTKDDVINQQNKLLEWKNSQTNLSGLSTYLFMKFLYISLDKFLNEKIEDEKLVEGLQTDSFSDTKPFQYTGKPQKKVKPKYIQGQKIYSRDKKKSRNALIYANFKCEVDENHQTFERKSSGKPYTEPHHLIPMAYSDDFEYSIDIEENIVSLCSHCHNEIHYGKNADELIKKLFKKRKELLKKAEIHIDETKLLQMY